MMEEVSDDTNGESTFEFVGGKSDENILKSMQESKDTDLPHSDQAPPTQQPVVVQAPLFPIATEPQFAFPVAPSPVTPSIQFYDPTQYATSSAIFTPFPPQQEPPQPTGIQNLHSLQESLPAAPVPVQSFQPPVQNFQPPVQNFQPAIPSEHNIPEVGIAVPGMDINTIPIQGGGDSGVWGWIKGTQFLNKVAEKAKSSVDTVITTLDPGMKEIINSGGDVSVVVASANEGKISAVREAFQLVFGKATVQGVAVQASSIAPQPVGFSAGLKAAEERIGNLRQQGFIQGNHVIVAVENFVTELTPENWFDIGCLLLQDQASGITLQVYTEAVPVSSHYVSQAKDQTPADYPLGWSGYAVTIGQVVGSALGVHHSEWHQALSGVSRREILYLAARTIAGLYKTHLRR